MERLLVKARSLLSGDQAGSVSPVVSWIRNFLERSKDVEMGAAAIEHS